ncbi:AAA domain protein [Escherichia coli 3-475-03_S4_C2]|nr:AAA domain protein [Escherichia coli 3-475-03_S4_C2]
METGRIPHNYVDPNFTIRGDKGDVTQVGLAGHGYDVRVYNRDFVSDNLNFLVNQTDGEIKTFAIVGEKNKEIEDAITAIQTRLGSVESRRVSDMSLKLKRKSEIEPKTIIKLRLML